MRWSSRPVIPRSISTIWPPRLKGVVEELWDTFESETDFLIEARNLAEFKRFAARFKYMDCPTAYTELCTGRIP